MELNDKDKEKAKQLLETVFSWGNKCSSCIHKDVCKHMDGQPKDSCDFHKYNPNPKRYGDIYEFFYPIFEWLEFHYPSGEVYFHVDKNSAKMLQEYRVSVYSKSLSNYCCCAQKDSTEDENK